MPAVDLRGMSVGDPCPGCARPLKALFTGVYCARDCDRDRPLPHTVDDAAGWRYPDTVYRPGIWVTVHAP